MFIPLKDTNPNLRRPRITYLLIAMNVGVFALQQIVDMGVFVFSEDLWLRSPLQALPTLLSYQFLHGSLSHLLFNMLFLYIFGDNMEGSLGARRFLIFYLIAGAFSALAEVWFDPNFGLIGPGLLIGASGSISGVLAAYMLRYPKAKILTWTLFIFFLEIPALWFIGIWLATQFLFEFLTPGSGTAYIAHIGGFVAGLILYGSYHRYRLSNIS